MVRKISVRAACLALATSHLVLALPANNSAQADACLKYHIGKGLKDPAGPNTDELSFLAKLGNYTVPNLREIHNLDIDCHMCELFDEPLDYEDGMVQKRVLLNITLSKDRHNLLVNNEVWRYSKGIFDMESDEIVATQMNIQMPKEQDDTISNLVCKIHTKTDLPSPTDSRSWTAYSWRKDLVGPHEISFSWHSITDNYKIEGWEDDVVVRVWGNANNTLEIMSVSTKSPRRELINGAFDFSRMDEDFASEKKSWYGDRVGGGGKDHENEL